MEDCFYHGCGSISPGLMLGSPVRLRLNGRLSDNQEHVLYLDNKPDQ